MTEPEPESGSLAGESVADAAETVHAAGVDDRDVGAIAATLRRVADDGVVTEAAVDRELGTLSNVVSTPENRLEVARIEVDEARETARDAGVADVPTVAARLDEFDARLDAVAASADDLAADLRRLVGRDDDEPVREYHLARGIERLTERANRLQQRADEVYVEAGEFDTWLEDHDQRVDRLREDVDAVAASVDDLADAVASLEDPDRDPGPDEADEPGVRWADAALRRRVSSLLVADARGEVDDLRELARTSDGAPDDPDDLDALADRLSALADRLSALDGRLSALARPAWRERHDDRLSGFDERVADVEPPVDWGVVQAALDDLRPVDDPDGADADDG